MNIITASVTWCAETRFMDLAVPVVGFAEAETVLGVTTTPTADTIDIVLETTRGQYQGVLIRGETKVTLTPVVEVHYETD